MFISTKPPLHGNTSCIHFVVYNFCRILLTCMFTFDCIVIPLKGNMHTFNFVYFTQYKQIGHKEWNL